jgi:ketosteroid isomerase-like protein
MSRRRALPLLLILVAGLSSGFGLASAQTPEEFYKKARMTIVVGSEEGGSLSMPATGNTVEMLEYCAMRFEGGKIAEAWFFADELGLARQIGIPIAARSA